MMPRLVPEPLEMHYEIIEDETPKLAQIQKVHDSDQKDWDTCMMARERIIICQQKAENDGF